MDWYVARTKPRREAEAAAILEQRGVRVYLPMLRKTRPRAGRRTSEPLFPGYLFARLQVPSEQWLAARSAPDVEYFLGQAGSPTPLPAEFVPALECRLQANDHAGAPSDFRRGDRVAIKHSPFEYVEAIFDRALTASGRVRVLVQFVHRQVAVNLSAWQLSRTS
jgi:transcriptional antiterminator RfaH